MNKKQYNIHTLQAQVESITKQFLTDTDGCKDSQIYQRIMSTVEESLITALMQYTSGNQKEAAEISGISRNTLRRKLEKYNINKSQ